MNKDSIAAIDLGTNSFRVQIVDIVDNRLILRESLKEAVQLGAGLDNQKMLDGKSQKRALETLSRFADRLRGFPTDRVRIVGTNTLRVAKNVGAFLYEAQKVLGFPIDVISGFEEARLIFNGAANCLPSSALRFVVDIGGGSTEVMIGIDRDLLLSSSLHMGCVSFSRRFFPDGKITRQSFEEAELAARCELLPIVESFMSHGWQEAVGCSGTIKVMCELSMLLGHTETLGECPRKTLTDLKAKLIKAGSVEALNIDLINSDRARVFAGGLSILLAVFDVFNIDKLDYSEGALLQGVLYDQIGRMQHEDLRDQTVRQIALQYRVDQVQVDRVMALALECYQKLSEVMQVGSESEPGSESDPDVSLHCQLLRWACQLHEIGKSISISGYHRHSAYIVRYGDLSGFSRQNQAYLAFLLFCQRGKIHHIVNQTILPKKLTTNDCALIFSLRLAVLCYRSRRELDFTWEWVKGKHRYKLVLDENWLIDNPLVDWMLTNEFSQWKNMPMSFGLVRKSGS